MTISKNAVATKNNDLISFMKNYSLNELRLLYFCIAHYDSRTTDNLRYEAHANDLVSIFTSLTLDNAYSIIDKAIVSINSKPLRFREGNKKKLRFWFSGLDYTEGEGLFEFRLSPDIEPYLLDLKKELGGFTSIRLADVYQFNSTTTWMLYEILRQYLVARKKAYSLDELKEKLGLEPSEYEEWFEFKRRVIEPHLKTINEVSDIEVTYTYIKKKNKITGLNFSIHPNDHSGIINVESSSDELYNAIMGIGIAEKKAQELLVLIKKNNKLGTITTQFNKKKKASKTKAKPTGWMINWIERECAQYSIEDAPKLTIEKCRKSRGENCSYLRDLGLAPLYSKLCPSCRKMR